MLASLSYLSFHEFPASHSEFYKQFERWRIDKASYYTCKEGVYFVLSNKPVSRCFGVDPEGILYIGKGEIFSSKHRIGKLVNALNNKEAAHEAGVRYQLRKYPDKFPLADLRIRIIVCAEARNNESHLLQAYLNLYGELPPLNHQL